MSKDIDEVWAKETKKAEQRRLRVGAYKPPPMKKVAKMLRAHRPLLLNWFHAKGVISSGVVEGFNKKVKLSIRKVYGF